MSDLFKELPPLPYAVNADVMAKARRIKLALFDVDGVLTDGRLHYTHEGETVKVFNALDGHGLKMLQQVGIAVGIITARQSEALSKRLNDLKIEHVYMGVNDKLACFNELRQRLNLAAEECAYTGDDVIDLPVMKACGLRCAVANAHFLVTHFADWTSPLGGGNGAARSVCDIILYSQKRYPLNSTHGQ